MAILAKLSSSASVSFESGTYMKKRSVRWISKQLKSEVVRSTMSRAFEKEKQVIWR